MNITLLGAGAFGKALGKILNDNGHSINYYDPAIFPDISLKTATQSSEVIVIVIPSIFLPDFIEQYPAELKQKPTILASKGLMDASLFDDFTQFSVISGPAFASEILDGKPATFTTSSPFAMSIFKNSQISIELSDDIKGIMLCGTLKNIYAIGAGYRSDSKDDVASFIEHAHAEMARYIENHGGEAHTADLACGIGDLILTCTSVTSRNYTFGQRLKGGDSVDAILNDLRTVEGYSAIQIVDMDDYPLISQIWTMISQNTQN